MEKATERIRVACAGIIVCFIIMFSLMTEAAGASYYVTDLKWVTGSAATAGWSPCDGANYYEVKVYVYRDSRKANLIGITETGTSDTRVDVQQEIYKVISGSSFDQVYVAFEVKPIYLNVYDGWEGSFSYASGVLTYRINPAVMVLPVPENVKISEDYVVSFDTVDSASWHRYKLQYEKENGEIEESREVTAYNDEHFEENVKARIYSDYHKWGLTNETIKVRASAMAYSYDQENPFYISSDYSDWSEPVTFNGSDFNQTQLPVPQNVKISEDYVVSFDTVKNASWHRYKLQYEKENGEIIESREITAYNDEHFEESVKSRIYSDYHKWGLTDETINVRASAMAYSYDQENPFYISSDYSDWSEPVAFNGSDFTQTKLQAPQNVALSEDYVISFDAVKNASWHRYKLQYEKENGEIEESREVTAYNDEHFVEDTSRRIYSDYKRMGLTNETIKVRAAVMAYSYDQENPFYISSDYSEWTEPVLFGGEKIVKEITLSPEKPVIYVGNSYYLGKTIKPASARYGSIKWTSSAPAVLTVDSYGRITGISEGRSNVTAAIGDVSDTVETMVYDIESNITNARDEKTVTDKAGDVIDGIVNSESPDLSNTDISSSDVPDLKKQIREGLDRGDQFRTDLNIEPRTENDYSHMEDVQAWLTEYKFAAASNVTLEMYHRDHGGNHFHIGNLIQLDNQIEVSLPFKSLPEPAKGFLREFLLLKIHKGIVRSTTSFTLINSNQPESSECVIQEDQFSDFILVYRDVEEPKEPEPMITVYSSQGGTAGYETSRDDMGIKVTLYAYPSDGYIFDSWQVLLGGAEIIDNTFYLGNTDVEIMAMFEPRTDIWNIESTVNGNGYLGIDHAKASKGQKITVTAIPDAGYELSELQAISSLGELSLSKEESDNYSFVMPDANVTVIASFDLQSQNNEENKSSEMKTQDPAQEVNETEVQPEQITDPDQTPEQITDPEQTPEQITDPDQTGAENKEMGEPSVAEQSGKEERDKPVPKTGDNAAPGTWLLLVLAGLLGIGAAGAKKSSR